MNRMIVLSLVATMVMGCHTRYSYPQYEQEEDSHPSSEDVLANIPRDFRPEMEKVLRYYDNDPDSLKYKAALFLITNMPGHKSYSGHKVEEYHHKLDSIISSVKIDTTSVTIYKDIQKLYDNVTCLAKGYRSSSFELKEDYEILSADILIRNIEESFDLWKNGCWARHLDFAEFCEFILPYKTMELYAPEDGWRYIIMSQIDSSIIRKLDNYIYSSEIEHSAFRSCQTLNAYLKQKYKYSAEKTPSQSPSVWKMSLKTRLPYGNCTDFSEITALFMRSIGIPVGVDYTPQWPFRSSGHCWNVLLMNNGKLKSFGGCDQDPEILHMVDLRMAKVYRKTYAVNREVEEILNDDLFVPDFMRDPFFSDVTNEYMRTSDITVDTKYGMSHGTCYLAVFNNRQWIPVCLGKKVNGKYFFKDLGRGIVYLPVRYSVNGVSAIADPFVLDEAGNIHTLESSSDEYECAELERKYYTSLWFHSFAAGLIGGKFQASNNHDFSDAVTVHLINKWSMCPDSVYLTSTRPYRYWRYLAPSDSEGDIAEIGFFEKNQNIPLKGTVIGNSGPLYPDNSGYDKYAAFDGDPMTFFDAPKCVEGTYVGMDYGKPVSISKIRYVPRNDDNNVSPGDLYELFYWSGKGWVSLGQQTARSNVLHYEKIPKNSLLLLRDLTKGRQERIFTLENGRQIWW